MKKNLRNRAFAFICTLLVVALMCANLSVNAAGPYSITINTVDDLEHTFTAYQIFKGDLSGTGEDAILSNIKWGDDIDESKISDELAKSETLKTLFAGKTTAAEIARVVEGFDDDSEELKAFAECVSNSLKTSGTESSKQGDKSYKIEITTSGYYIIKDSIDDNQYGVYSRHILRVLDNVTMTAKAEKPSLKKSLDEEGTKKVTDVEINESFEEYLTATLPVSPEFDEYKTYEITFEDTMTEGLTFDDIESITIEANTATSEKVTKDIKAEDTKYDFTQPTEPENKFTLKISDLKSIVTEMKGDFSKGVKVVVRYKVHLNNKATSTAYSASAVDAVNKNTATLSYSNNPNQGNTDKLGKTPEEINYVFTYTVNNKKVDASSNDPIVGAGFTLYYGDEKTDPVKLVFDETLEGYRPATKSEISSAGGDFEIKSQGADATFNIYGLKAGKYTLSETTTPAGYDTCDDIEINIATSYDEDKVPTQVNFTSEGNMENTVQNQKGVNLPNTGAITLVVICVIGAVLGVTGVVLSRKGKEE